MNGNNEFLKNIKEQIANIEKRNYTTPEQRAQAFEWIIIQMQEYKETAIFTEKELLEFEKIFNWLNSEYKKLNIETKQKVQELDNQVTFEKSQVNSEKIFSDSYNDNISIKNLNTQKADRAINIIDSQLKEILNKKDNLKLGLDIISAIANGKIEKKFFPNISDKEFEQIKKSLPAIRWIAGAILLENLKERWYNISFDKNNKIILKSDHKDDNNVNKIINSKIKQNPSLEDIIKEGLLFMDGNILKYGKAHTDTNSENLDISAMTSEKYLNFLKWEKEKSWATKIILSNPQILDWMNLAKMAESSQYFTPVLENMNTRLQKQVQSAVQKVEKNNWTSMVSNNEKFDWSEYSKWWEDTKKWLDSKDPLSSLGYLAGSSIGLLGVAADDLADSFRDKPQAVGGVILLSFLSFIFLGFKDTIKLMTGLTIGWLAYKNFVKDSKNETSETVEISQNQKDSQNERLYNSNKTKSKEQVKEVVEMVSIFYPEKLSELNAYFSGKWDGVSKDLKAKLDTLNTEQIAELKKAVNEGNSGLKKFLDNPVLDDETKKEIEKNMTLRKAMDLNLLTPQDIKATSNKALQSIIDQMPEWEEKQALQEKINSKEIDETDTLMTLLWVAGWAGLIITLWVHNKFWFAKLLVGTVKIALKVTTFVPNLVWKPLTKLPIIGPKVLQPIDGKISSVVNNGLNKTEQKLWVFSDLGKEKIKNGAWKTISSAKNIPWTIKEIPQNLKDIKLWLETFLSNKFGDWMIEIDIWWDKYKVNRNELQKINEYLTEIKKLDWYKLKQDAFKKIIKNWSELLWNNEIKDFKLKEGKFNFKAFVEKLFAHTLKK